MSLPKKKPPNTRSAAQISTEDRRPKQFSHNILSSESPKDQYRQRTLELLERSLGPLDISRELEAQLKAKDILIEQLNAKLITALASSQKIEPDCKDRSSKDLLEDRQKSIQDLSALQSLYSSLLEKHDDLLRAFDTQKDTWEIQIEALTEDNEELKKHLTAKEEAINISKRDVTKMSTIVTELTHLNGELNGKIAALNEEMERKNKEHYEAVMKMRQTEELEKELAESKMQAQVTTQKLDSLRDVAAENSDLRHLFHAMSESLVANLGKIELSCEQTKSAVAAIDALLKDLIAKSSAPRAQPEAKLAYLKQEVARLKLELVNFKRAVAIALADKQYHESQAAAVRGEVTKLKNEYELSVQHLQEKGRLVQGSVDYLLKTRKKSELALEAAKGELARKTAECQYLNGQITALKRWEFDVKTTNNELKQALSSLQTRFIEANKLSVELEQSNIALYSENRSILAKNAALKEELWKRDNNSLRKECKKIKLMEEVNSLRSTIQISYTRLRNTESEEDKSRKILLPRMDKGLETDKTVTKGYRVPAEIVKRLENALKVARSSPVKHKEKDRLASISLRELKIDLMLYLHSSLTTDEVRDYDTLRELFISLSVGSLTVQELIDEIGNSV